MITAAQVADLHPGDVVELRGDKWHPDVVLRGPVRNDLGRVHLGPLSLRWPDGSLADMLLAETTLTVVSRAPRPLYVNHPRTEPVAGDVVRDEESGNKMALFICTTEEPDDVWWLDTAADWISPSEMREKRLRLLVDGETGRCVQ